MITLMEAQLDSTLVASEQITARMNSQKSEYYTEIANAVQVLSPLQQKRVEDTLNEIYGEMKEKERIERLREWDKKKYGLVSVYYSSRSFKTMRGKHFACIPHAIKALQKWLPPMVRVSLGTDNFAIGPNLIKHPIYLSPSVQKITTARVQNDQLIFNNDSKPSSWYSHGYGVLKYLNKSKITNYELTPDEIIAAFGPEVSTQELESILIQFKRIIINGHTIFVEWHIFDRVIDWKLEY